MDSILFDLDGTLWDSTEVVADAWNQALETFPQVAFRATPDNLKQLFGRPLDEIARMIVPELNDTERAVLLKKLYEVEDTALQKTPGRVYEGVRETLEALSRKYKLCIVSNCQAGYIELFLEKTGFQKYITDFECPGYTGLSKGENNKLVMERNQLTAPVYVGDTQGDLNSARFAGIPFVFASYGFGAPEEYEYRLTQFSDLLKLF